MSKQESGDTKSGGEVCSALKFDDSLVARIVQRAKESDFGLGESDGGLRMTDITPQDSKALAMVLVGRYHAKYDLVAIFEATINELIENNANVHAPTGARNERSGGSCETTC